MRVGNALVFIVCVSRLQLFFASCCCWSHHKNDSTGGHCPLRLSPVPSTEPGGPYSECVSVHVCRSTAGFHGNATIKILSPMTVTVKRRGRKQWKGKKCWLVHDCIKAKAQSTVSVSFNTISTSCICNYTVPDPVPEFHLSVEQRSKSINVTVEHGAKVYAMLCYQKDPDVCYPISPSSSTRITIDPSQSVSAILRFRYLLPCVCVQVYYTFLDSRRATKCPFVNESLGAVRDVWDSSKVTLYESSVEWRSEHCPVSYLRPSAALCWRQHTHLCTPIFNSTLQEIEDINYLKYNTSTVDKHPQMCVQFSLQGSHDIHCLFQSDKSSWEANIRPGRQSVFVYLTSSVPAKLSAQLCIQNKSGCTSRGRVYSIRMEGDTVEKQINVPVSLTTEKLCVQVWQSDPVQHGKRILCPDFTHQRVGMFAVAALVFVIIVALLGILIHHVTKNGAAGWLSIQKPVLLVCSSEESAYVSTVCALASILQEELCATVCMALWAQSSPMAGVGAGTGVADLGPVPWLYGQWEAVHKAQGKMLVIWSPEAKKTYEKWREDGAELNRKDGRKEDNKGEVRLEKKREQLEEDWKIKGRRVGKFRKEIAAGKHDSGKSCDDECDLQKEPSPVTGPVFIAALACLQGLLQECKGHGVAFVYFQGLSHSRDIPKDFRGVPRYCLPQDFRGLIQELGGVTTGTKNDTSGWHCWPRLLSKMLSLWLARRLAHRLTTWLPKTHGKKIQHVTPKSSQKYRTQSKLKLQQSASMTTAGITQEQEPLHRLLWKGEELESQVSPI